MSTIPSADVFARTIPLKIERHYFGEHKQANKDTVQTATDKAYLTLTKRLLAMPATSAIRNHDERFRLYLRENAIPFDDSLWLVPFGMFDRVRAKAIEWERVRREELVPAAKTAYPAQVEAMRIPLGPNFNPADYPSPDEFAARFWVRWRFLDLGAPVALREISVQAFEEERQKVREEGERARHAIEQHLASMLEAVSGHIVELLQPKANGRSPSLRPGALDPLFEYLNTLPLRDVTNFSELRAVTDRLQRAAAGVTVEALRDDEGLRTRFAAAAAAAQEAVGALIVEGGARAIRVRDDEEDAA
jgi:hypothetical protein